MTKDLIEVADVDFNNVNITSIIVVFVIIAIVFRSASVPVLLVAAIESAIMINLGIPYFTGTTLPFITSIVIGTIQLGATVDYAILMTTRFREERNAGHIAKEAAQIAVEQCSQSILTSGLTFFAATFMRVSSPRMELIGVPCSSQPRRTHRIRQLSCLCCLRSPVLTEPILRKTTFHWLKKPEITRKRVHNRFRERISINMSKYLTKSVAATISALLLLGCAAPAFAADATVEKKETFYLSS